MSPGKTLRGVAMSQFLLRRLRSDVLQEEER